MTLRILKDRTVNEYPVEFTIYKLARKDVIIVDNEGKPKTIAKQGEPHPHTFGSVVLYRLINKGETVRDKIKEFQKMFEGGEYRYQVKWAPETDAERIQRYKDNDLEVVAEEKVGKTLSEDIPIINPTVVNDADLIPEDTGRIKPKRKSAKATKEAKAA